MLVLDTHAWVWWIAGPGGGLLSSKARAYIDEADKIGISAISCVEVAWLVARGRLTFDRDVLVWIKQALARPRVLLLEISPEIAVSAANLDWSHRDPADRIIVATALRRRAPVVSKDEQIQVCNLVQTVW